MATDYNAYSRAFRFWMDLKKKYHLATVGGNTNHESINLEIEQLIQDTIRNTREEMLATLSQPYSKEDDND